MKYEMSRSINSTKESFEESFETENFYNKQTQDKEHLEKILNILKINNCMKILDLGTGTGYLAFPIAEQYSKVEVTGLDIVERALNKNRERAKAVGLMNLQFINYDGVTFPFTNDTFDMVITRYALHHFPAIKDTFQEISRVLKPNGIFFLADPTPNDADTERFVDAYMQMKKDGHIKFYTKKEWQTIGGLAGFKFVDSFDTYIRFPKKKANALELEEILKRFDKQVIDEYNLKYVDDEIWITEKVNNLFFRKI